MKVEEPRPTYPAGELLQTATTIAAIALAIGAFVENPGPEIEGRFLIQTTLLFGGLFAVAGSVYALRAMKNELDSATPGFFYLIEWALWVTGSAYVWLMIDNVP